MEREAGVESAVGDEPVRAAALRTQIRRRGVEHVVHDARHLAHGAEPGRERDVGDREIAVIEQPSSEVRPSGAADLVGCGADVLEEQPPQVTRADAQARGEGRFVVLVEQSVRDQAHPSAHELGALDPRLGVMGAVGAALEARPEAVRLGCGSALVGDDVGRVGRRLAARVAVDPGGSDGGEGHSSRCIPPEGPSSDRFGHASRPVRMCPALQAREGYN